MLDLLTRPGRPSKLLGFVMQRQYVTHGQDVSLRRVLKLSHAPAGAYQPERAPLFALFEEGLPELLNLRPEAGFCKVVNSAADDSVPWKPEQLATATGVPIIPIIVRDEDGFGRLVDKRPEQQSKLFQAAIQQPLAVRWLGRCGGDTFSPSS